jgi:hypothetical protein
MGQEFPMICFSRVTIHDHLYELLHPEMEAVHFLQEFVDGADGKRRHALPGIYVSDQYPTPKLAFLSATVAAIRVDPNAQLMMLAGDQIFSHACREEEQYSFASVFAELAKSCPPLPGLHDYFANSQDKGGGLAAIAASGNFGKFK